MRYSLAMLLCLCLGTTNAQVDESPVVHGAAGYIEGGGGVIALSNSYTIRDGGTANIQGYDENFTGASIGVGGELLFQTRFVLEARGFISSFPETDATNIILNEPLEVTRSLTTYSGILSLGYVFYNRNRWIVFPSIGLGWMTVSEELNHTGQSIAEYGPYQLDPGENLRISLNQTVFDVKVSAQRLFPLPNVTNKITVGIDLGYSGNFGQRKWSLTQDLEGSSELWYLKLKLGFGSFRR